jgi:hypothetical protein
MPVEVIIMQAALRVQTTILPGGKIEIVDPQLLPGKAVEVIIVLLESPTVERHSAIDILADLEGQRLFKTAEDVDAYLRQEREAWEN